MRMSEGKEVATVEKRKCLAITTMVCEASWR